MKKELKIALYIALGIFGTHILFILLFIACWILLVILAGLEVGLQEQAYGPAASLGEHTAGPFYSLYLFQDGAEHQKFHYENPNFEGNPYFKPVTEECIDELLRVLDDFEGGWINGLDDAPTEEGRIFYQGYDYDRASLDPADYYYLDTSRANYPLEVYDLYIFDAQQNTLYYFYSAS